MDIDLKSLLGPHSRSLWPRRHHSSREKSDALQSKATPLTSPLPQGRWQEHPTLSRPRPRSAVTVADAHRDSDCRPINNLQPSIEPLGQRRTSSSRNANLRISPPTRDFDMWNTQIDASLVRDPCFGGHSSDLRSQYCGTNPSQSSYMSQQPDSLSHHSATQSSSPPSRGTNRDIHDSSQADAILSDENEVHLFAQAIVGFGHEEPFAMQPVPQAASSLRQGHRPPMLRTRSEQQPSYMAPAYEETPTTLFALHGLAAMPQQSATYRPHDTLSYTMAAQSIVPSSTTYSCPPDDDPSSWTIVSNSFPSHREHPDVSPIDDDDEDAAGFGRDQPPDYAASQAQVYVSQRIEATKRAQELQRRWRQAH